MIRLGLTSTPERNAAFEAAARRRGFEPVSLPCIRIEELPLDGARLRARAGRCDVLVLTSATTVSILADHDAFPDLPVVAVGEATAARARAVGAEVLWVGSGGAHHLASGAAPLLRGRRLLFAGAANAVATTIGLLDEVATSVHAVPAYTTVPAPPPGDRVDAVTFASPSAVAGWLSSRDLDGLVVGAIGPTTAEALERVGTVPDVVPSQPGFEALIDAMAALRPERSAT